MTGENCQENQKKHVIYLWYTFLIGIVLLHGIPSYI